MSTRNLTCIGCPMGCQLTAELAGGEVVSVRGNTCARGEAYARKECAHPARTVTGTVRCEGGVLPVVSVRTADEVPKEKVFDVARALGAVTVRAPLHIGDVVLAEPKALIGFAGPRVIEQTVREKLPEGFQRSEFLLKTGQIDQIVDRRDMRARISEITQLLMKKRPVNGI